MTQQKKQAILLTMLILLVIGMGIGYAALKKVNEIKEEEANQSIELYQLDTKKAKEITIVNENGTIDFMKSDGKWKSKADSKFPVDTNKIDTILDSMKTINANSQVTDGTEELGQYGLDKPASSIFVTLNNDVKAKISFGSQVPVLGGYYVLIDNDTKVYTMSEDLYQAIQVKQMDFVKMETFPSIESEKITGLTVSQKEKNEFSVVKERSGSYVIKDAYEETVLGSGEKILDLFSNYNNLSFDSCVEYNCTDFKQYGLEHPKQSITISYNVKEEEKTEKNEYVLYIGNQNEDGSYYVRPKDSSYVYLISSDTIEELIHVTIFDYVENTIFSFATDTLTSFTIENEKGEKTSLDTKNDLDTLTAIQALTYSGEIEKSGLEDTKIYTCKIKNNNKNSVITFLPYDKTNYRVKKEDQELFLANKKAVDKLLKNDK